MTVHVGEVGKILYVTCDSDVSASTTQEIECVKPSGATVVYTATVGGTQITDPCGNITPADFYIQYTFQTGDLDEAGNWTVRAVITTGSVIVKGSRDTFTVRQ